MTSVSLPDSSITSADGLRPINLRTDLAPLADLIELVFANSMDFSGRAAVREMRTLSRMGVGLRMLASMNDLAQGISLGYVWIANGKLVGNVSVYAAGWPASVGSAWIIANVGVHPDYQRQGIARRMLRASMDAIRDRDGDTAILQVDQDNFGARRLYESLGFVEERAWTTWRRDGIARIPPPLEENMPHITTRQGSEWQSEYNLARRLRPQERGGLGWLRPLHVGLFRRSLWQHMNDWINFRNVERLVIRGADHPGERAALLASLWIENSFVSSNTQLTLLVEPEFQGYYDEALLNLAVRRFGGRRAALTIDHPDDEAVTNAILKRNNFRPQRTVVHMRWDVR